MFQPAIVTPLFDAVRTRSQADGVYLYRIDAAGTASLLAWSGPAPGAVPALVRIFGGRAMTAAIVIHEGASTDVRFQVFDEFLAHRFEGLVAVPLIHNSEVLGRLHVCYSKPRSLPAYDAAFLFGLGLPLGALLAAGAENQSLRDQLETLSQSLADRKIFDRAKGLLQARHDWTEEEAYLHLRRISRQRRTAMREIAREIIAGADIPVLEVRRAS